MRDLKFRHWSEEAGMSKPFTLDDWDFLAGLSLHGDSSTVMQFVGLCDKNGVEIYEGDIMEGFDGKGRLFIVECDRNAFVLRGGETALAEPCYFEERIIVGNVYENPELAAEA